MHRMLPHGGEQISVIGLGSGSLSGTEQEMTAVLDTAIQNGVNYFDMVPSEAAPFPAYAKAFFGRRDKVITQMESVYTAITASLVLRGWTWDLLISITTWPLWEIPWLQGITGNCQSGLTPVSSVDIVSYAVRFL